MSMNSIPCERRGSISTEEPASYSTVIETTSTSRKRRLNSPDASTPEVPKIHPTLELSTTAMDLYKTARNNLTKLVKATHKTYYFQACLDQNVLPIGLRLIKCPRTIPAGSEAFRRWEETLISGSRSLLQISYESMRSVMDELEKEYNTSKDLAIQACRNSTEREDTKNALEQVGTRLDGTLKQRFSENLKWDRDHEYSPTSLESLVSTRGAAKPPAEIRDGRRNSRPRNRRNNDRQTGDRRAVYPSYQPMDMNPSDKNFQDIRRNSTTGNRRYNDHNTGERRTVYPSNQLMDMNPSDKNFQSFYNAFTAFNNLFTNQNNHISDANEYNYTPYTSDVEPRHVISNNVAF